MIVFFCYILYLQTVECTVFAFGSLIVSVGHWVNKTFQDWSLRLVLDTTTSICFWDHDQ